MHGNCPLLYTSLSLLNQAGFSVLQGGVGRGLQTLISVQGLGIKEEIASGFLGVRG